MPHRIVFKVLVSDISLPGWIQNVQIQPGREISETKTLNQLLGSLEGTKPKKEGHFRVQWVKFDGKMQKYGSRFLPHFFRFLARVIAKFQRGRGSIPLCS